MRSGEVEAATAELEIARAECSSTSLQERLDLLWAESALALATEDVPAIERVARDMLEIGTHIGDQEMQAKAHWFAGGAASLTGDSARVRREYGEAARLFELLHQPQSLSATCINLGAHFSDMGLFDLAAEQYSRGAELATATGARNIVAIAMGNIAEIEHVRGNTARAREIAAEALAIAKTTGDSRAIAGCLTMVGEIEYAVGNIESGLKYLRDAIDVRRTLGHGESLAHTLGTLGLALADAGRNEETLAPYRELEELLQPYTDPLRVPTRHYVALARLARLHGEPEKAEALERRAGAAFVKQRADLPDDESRAAFSALAHNRALAAAATLAPAGRVLIE